MLRVRVTKHIFIGDTDPGRAISTCPRAAPLGKRYQSIPTTLGVDLGEKALDITFWDQYRLRVSGLVLLCARPLGYFSVAHERIQSDSGISHARRSREAAGKEIRVMIRVIASIFGIVYVEKREN